MTLIKLFAPRNLLIIFAAHVAGAALFSAAYLLWLPDVRPLKEHNPSVTSYMLLKEHRAAALGKKLERRMAWTEWDNISEHLKHAVLVAEDDGFYLHKGVDWTSTWKAIKSDLRTRRLARGGSTITQQTARNLYLSPSKNPLRKIKEILIARRLEKHLGKRRIFEIYLNVAEWGKGIYGAQAAAQAYFGKNASDLTPEEAAALAAVLPSPRRYNPVKGTRFMEKRKDQITDRMRASGYLPDETALNEPIISTSFSADPYPETPLNLPGEATEPLPVTDTAAVAPHPMNQSKP